MVLFSSFINPRIRIVEILMCSQVSRPRMPFEILSSRASCTKTSNLATRFFVYYLLIRLCFQILANPQPAGVSPRFPRRQYVVCSNAL